MSKAWSAVMRSLSMRIPEASPMISRVRRAAFQVHCSAFFVLMGVRNRKCADWPKTPEPSHWLDRPHRMRPGSADRFNAPICELGVRGRESTLRIRCSSPGVRSPATEGLTRGHRHRRSPDARWRRGRALQRFGAARHQPLTLPGRCAPGWGDGVPPSMRKRPA